MIKIKTNHESSELHETSRIIIVLILSATRRPILQTTFIMQNRESTSCFIQLRNSKYWYPMVWTPKQSRWSNPCNEGNELNWPARAFWLYVAMDWSLIPRSTSDSWNSTRSMTMISVCSTDTWWSADHHWSNEKGKQKNSPVSTSCQPWRIHMVILGWVCDVQSGSELRILVPPVGTQSFLSTFGPRR